MSGVNVAASGLAPAAGATGAMVPPRARKSTPAGGVGPTAVDDAPRSLPPEKAAAAPAEPPVVSDAVGSARPDAPTDPGAPPAVDGESDALLATWDDVTPAVGATFPVAAAPDSAPGSNAEARDDAALEALLEPSGGVARERRPVAPAALAGRGESADRERESSGTAREGGFDLASAMAARPLGAERPGVRSAPPAATAESLGVPREQPTPAVARPVASERPPAAAAPVVRGGPGSASPGRPPESHRSQVPAHAVPRAQGIVEEEASVVIAVDAASPSAPTAPTAVAEDELLPVATSPWWWEHRLVVGLGLLAIVALLIAAARVTLFAPAPVTVDVPAPARSALPAPASRLDETAARSTTSEVGTVAEGAAEVAEPGASSSAHAAASADVAGAPEPSPRPPPRRRPRRPPAAALPAVTAPVGDGATGEPAAPGATGAGTPTPAAAPPSEPTPGGRGSPIERDSPF